jgi:hypothetical protein
VEEKDGVTRRGGSVTARDRLAGWRPPRARVLSCLYARHSHHASRVKVVKTVNCLGKRELDPPIIPCNV